MNEIDAEILKELMKNPRVSLLDISGKLGVSSSTVRRRFDKMKEDGLIFRMTTIVDLLKIGFQGKAFLFIAGSRTFDADKIIKNVFEIPNVFQVSSIVGSFDMLVMTAFKNVSEIKTITDTIKSYPGVKGVKVAVTIDGDYPVKREFLNIAVEKDLI